MSRPTTKSGERIVAVIGAGVAGLAATVRLRCASHRIKVILLEEGSRIGGLLHTVNSNGFLIEEAADGISVDQSTGVWNLCQQIGLIDQMVSAPARGHQAMILQGNRLRPIPAGFLMMSPTRFWPLITTRILTIAGKLRLAMEPFMSSSQRTSDESVAEFARRRLGRQAYERLVQPIAEAIYGTDPERLSVAATMPRIVEMERLHGSLFRANTKERGARSSVHGMSASHGRRQDFRAPEGGMSSFVAALARQLPADSISVNSPVERLIRRSDGRWGIIVRGYPPNRFIADGVILAAPANKTAQIVNSVQRQLAGELDAIEYSSRIHVTLGYRNKQLARPLYATGYFFPRSARKHVRSLTVVSEKFPYRAPQGYIQLRIAIAAWNGQSIDHFSDCELIEIAGGEVAPLLAIEGKPSFCHVVRHRQAVPHYTVGHLARMTRIDAHLAGCRGLALAGAAYRGIGVPQCIRSGEEAAETILRFFDTSKA